MPVVDEVNLIDPEGLPEVTDLTLLEFYSHRGDTNRRLTGENLGIAIVEGAYLATENTIDPAADHVLFYDASAGTARITAIKNIQGDDFDINALAAEANIDSGADYLAIYDASAGANRKVSIQNLISLIEGGGSGSTGAGHDSLAAGTVTAQVTRIGGTAATINSPAQGEYIITIPAGATVLKLNVFGNSSTLNGSQEFVLRIDNSANGRDFRGVVQLYSVDNGALVDPFNDSLNHTQNTSGNITSITFPGMNLFGTPGFFVDIS